MKFREGGHVDETVIVISHVRARRGYEAIVRDTLKKLIIPSLAEEGCLEYKVFESAVDATFFVSYQVWASEKHRKAHGDTAHMAGFRRIAPTVLDGPPAYSKWKNFP
jgi:quinol monooxygenase YgiN